MKNKNWRVARDFRIIQRIRKPSKNWGYFICEQGMPFTIKFKKSMKVRQDMNKIPWLSRIKDNKLKK